MSIAIQLSNLGTTEDGEFTLVPTDLMDTIQSLLSKPTTRKTKVKKDPSKPKKPLNAYMRWLGEVGRRATIIEFLLEGGEDVKPKQVLVEAGEQWKLVSDEDKLPFVEAYEAEKVIYAEKMLVYSPPSSPTEDYDTVDTPDAPEGWNGPFVWTFLTKCVKGDDGKALKFQDFDEAVSKANETEECGGITKTTTGYSLRHGTKTKSNAEGSRSGMASWLKPSTISITKKDNSKMLDGKTMKPVEKKVKKTKAFKKKEPEPEPEPQPEPEPESEEESDDEELDVEEVDIDGKKYYKDAKGIVYDPESGDEVGAFVDGEYVAN